MENKTVFVITLKGEGEIKNHSHQLPEDIKRVLTLVDDESTVEILARRAAPSLRAGLKDVLQQLENGGYIRNKASPAGINMPRIATPKIVAPQKQAAPSKQEEVDDLDFTSVLQVRTEAEEKAEREAEVIRIKKEEAAVAKAQLEAAQIKAEAEAKAHAVAEAKAKREAEAARLKVEQATAKMRAEAEAVRIKAEQEAEKAKAELEAARMEASRVRTELEAARVESEALAKREEEVAQLRKEAAAATLHAEAEIARIKAEREAALAEARTQQEAEAVRIRAEAEAKAKQEAQAIRREAEEEVAKARAEAEAARLQAEQEMAKAKNEAEAKVKQEADAARLKAEQQAAKARHEAEALAKQHAEAARLKAEQEIARVKAEAEEQIRLAAQAKSNAESALAAKIKADASAARSMIATVLFFDVVGYTKQSVSKQIELKNQFNKLVSEFIRDIDETQRIILDTGDGAAIGFLQHPEDAIEVALKFRNAVTANKHRDYPDLMVRIGIHLGPVNVVKDMNGQSNMVGDGINDAQRIMSFASSDRIYISRSYYDVVSRLSAEYAKLFQYRGVKNDKHGRQHQVYEAAADEAVNPEPAAEQPGNTALPQTPQDNSFSIQLDPSFLNNLGQGTTSATSADAAPEAVATATEQTADVQEIIQIVLPDEIAQETPAEAEKRAQAEQAAQREAEAARLKAEKEAETARLQAEQKAQQEAQATRLKTEQETAKAEKEARKLADEQAKAWSEAEQRAKKQAATAAAAEAQQPTITPRPAPHVRRKPLPLGKIAAGLFVLLLVLIAALPYVWPMQGYIAPLEQKLSAQLQQPVHIAHIKASLLPLPRLELQDVSIGNSRELKAASVTLNFSAAALFGEVKPINNAEINDLDLDAGSFAQTLTWLQSAGGDAHYPVARMTLKHAHISGGGLNLPAVNGSADGDSPGHFSKVLLRSDNGKLDVEMQLQQSRWQIALRLKESSLPWLPNIQFSELNANGEVDEHAADFSGIEGFLYNGKLSGNAHMEWQKDWQMRGRLSIRAMALQQALPQLGIEGDMDGEGSFLLSGATLAQLASTQNLDGSFVVSKGVISKMDMVESAANHQGTTGGRTHFDEMSGTLQMANNSSHVHQLRIASGAMSSIGSVDVEADGQLSGRLSVNLKMRPGNTPLTLSGTLSSPVLR